MAEPSDANKRQKPEDAAPAFSDTISNFAVEETLRFEAGGRLAVVLGKLDGRDCVLELKQRAALADPQALEDALPKLKLTLTNHSGAEYSYYAATDPTTGATYDLEAVWPAPERLVQRKRPAEICVVEETAEAYDRVVRPFAEAQAKIGWKIGCVEIECVGSVRRFDSKEISGSATSTPATLSSSTWTRSGARTGLSTRTGRRGALCGNQPVCPRLRRLRRRRGHAIEQASRRSTHGRFARRPGDVARRGLDARLISAGHLEGRVAQVDAGPARAGRGGALPRDAGRALAMRGGRLRRPRHETSSVLPLPAPVLPPPRALHARRAHESRVRVRPRAPADDRRGEFGSRAGLLRAGAADVQSCASARSHGLLSAGAFNVGSRGSVFCGAPATPVRCSLAACKDTSIATRRASSKNRRNAAIQLLPIKNRFRATRAPLRDARRHFQPLPMQQY